MRSRWLGAPASDDRGGPPKVGRGALPRATQRGPGITERGLETKIAGHHPKLCSPLSFNGPLRKKRVPSPTPWPAGVHYHKPSPTPSPLHPSLPCSLWSPLESRCGSQIDWFLKETNSRGGKWQGGLCLAGRERFGVAPLWAPLVLDPPAGGTLGISLGLWGLGDWGAGVNTVSGSWTVCVMGLWGPQRSRHALEQENRKAAGWWGQRGMLSTPAHPLQGAQPPSSPIRPSHLPHPAWVSPQNCLLMGLTSHLHSKLSGGIFKCPCWETSLVVQWLRIRLPRQGTRV